MKQNSRVLNTSWPQTYCMFKYIKNIWKLLCSECDAMNLAERVTRLILVSSTTSNKSTCTIIHNNKTVTQPQITLSDPNHECMTVVHRPIMKQTNVHLAFPSATFFIVKNTSTSCSFRPSLYSSLNYSHLLNLIHSVRNASEVSVVVLSCNTPNLLKWQ